MGQIGSSNRRRHHHHATSEMTSNNIVFAAATPYPQYPNPNIGFHHYPRYDQHRYPYGHVNVMPPQAYVEHQKTVTIRNDVNLKKETLRIQPDEQNPGSFLVSFTFDATVSGTLSVVFFGKEGEGCCSLTPVKETMAQPMAVQFQKGSAQKFKQPFGSGIDLSMFEEGELVKAGDTGEYPLAVIAQASLDDGQIGSTNSQITLAVFEKEKGGYQVRVVKQILFVQGQRYELQEIYGIGNSVGDDFDGNDPGKECVICLSEPRDTAVLPCRHMCMCSGCARVLRSQTNRCPICRQLVDRLLEIKVNNSNYNGTGK